MTPADAVVLDASVFLRAAVVKSTAAHEWLDAVEAGRVAAHVPDLVYAEIGNGLLRYVRRGAVTAADAALALATATAYPVHVHGLGGLASGAFAKAVEAGLSAYDGCYAALAESLDAVLVTADKGLAAAVPGAELLA